MAKNKTSKSDPKKYWSAADTKTCAAEVRNRVEQYYQFLATEGYIPLWALMYANYYGGMNRGGRINAAGAQGEYQIVNTNHFRNLLEHIQQLVVSSRPVADPRAINSDAKSLKQTILAKGLLDYYIREKRLENQLFSATEYALVFGEGFIIPTWDATAGEQVGSDPDTEEDIRTGDLMYEAKEPIDIIRDPRLDNYRSRDWLVVRSYVNRYTLMAKYPEFADKISVIETRLDAREHYRADLSAKNYDTDQIILYTFYHAKTDACPDGRQMQLLQDDITLTDGPLGYRHIPVYRMVAKEKIGSPMGYTVAYDLAALQENYDMLFSTITTNQRMFGVQNVLVPKGMGFNPVDMGGGMNFIEYDATNGGKPEPMNLTKTPPEIFNMLTVVEAQMQTVSGINSVSRGDPQASLKSGAALALVQSMAIQFNQSLQFGYVKLCEDVFTATIQMLQDYASIPRTAAIAGKYDRSFMQEFSSKDLMQLDRVQCDLGNPVMQTAAGKMELAGQMLQAGFIKDPSELLMVIQTGNLQPLIEGRTAELMGIRGENEYLQDGKPVPVMLTDDHKTHIQEHKSLGADPSFRTDPEKMKVLLDHIQEHLSFITNPGYAQVLTAMGQPLLPQTAPGQSPPGGAPGQPPNGAAMQPPGGGNANAQVAAMQPHPAQMPVNPMTQQRVPAPQ